MTVDPSWLLAPLFVRDIAALARAGAGDPGPLRPAVTELVPDHTVTEGIDTEAAEADWPTWWAGALAYRPGTPAPRPQDLFAGSEALGALWSALSGRFEEWLAAVTAQHRHPDADARAVERAALAGFAVSTDREPGRWTVRILEIPVTGDYLHSPEPRRIVVSAALRDDPDRYSAALAAELPQHF